MKHIKLANRVIEMLLNGEDEMLSLLRNQYENADIISEEDNEVGFYINYQVKNENIITKKYNTTFQIGDVDGIVNGLQGAVGFILYIKNGYLMMLEGYTNLINKWPETDSQIELSYDTVERDYGLLKKIWEKKL